MYAALFQPLKYYVILFNIYMQDCQQNFVCTIFGDPVDYSHHLLSRTGY